MTIRRNVDIRALNADLEKFEEACERAPEGVFKQAKEIRFMIGTQADALLGTAQAMGLKTCNCDGIREIEALVFNMIRFNNPESEIESAIGLGDTLLSYPETADRVIAGLTSDRDFLLANRKRTAIDFAKSKLAAGVDWQEIADLLLNDVRFEALFPNESGGLIGDEATEEVNAIIRDAEDEMSEDAMALIDDAIGDR